MNGKLSQRRLLLFLKKLEFVKKKISGSCEIPIITFVIINLIIIAIKLIRSNQKLNWVVLKL